MLKIDTTSTIDWPVRVQVSQSGGGFTTMKFMATFSHLPKSESNALAEKATKEAEAEGRAFTDFERTILEKVLVRVAEVQIDGAEVDENNMRMVIEYMLDHPRYCQALMEAYKECQGRADAKN